MGRSIKVSGFMHRYILYSDGFIIMQAGSLTAKYTHLLTPHKLGFLEYYMLPEKDEFDYIYRAGDDSFLMLSVLKNELPGFPPPHLLLNRNWLRNTAP